MKKKNLILISTFWKIIINIIQKIKNGLLILKILFFYKLTNNYQSKKKYNIQAIFLKRNSVVLLKSALPLKKKYNFKSFYKKIVISIDAGHGGQDPGAIGKNKIQEKNINLSIAKKLQLSLNKTKLFKVIMIRSGNYFLPISERIKIAKKKTNLLISIHANSSNNRKLFGSSVWMLSNNYKNLKTNNYKKKFFYIKSNKKINIKKKNINNNNNLTYTNSKLNNFYNTEIKIGNILLKELQNINPNKKITLKHALFKILKSSNFPSILIETGFISNPREEKKLNNKNYQQRIVKFICIGLKKYFFPKLFK